MDDPFLESQPSDFPENVKAMIPNRTLEDVIQLLERDIESLKLSLETWRLSDHKERAQLIQWHVNQLDERQNELEALKNL